MTSEVADAVTAEGKEGKGLVPKRRFLEFRDAGPWTDTQLENVLVPMSRDVAKPSSSYTGLGLRSHCKGTFQKPEQNPEKNSMDRLYVVHRDDLILNITFAWEGAIAIARDEDHGCYVSHRFPTYEFKQDASSPNFFRYVITDKDFVYRLGVISPGGAGRNRVMSKNDFLRLSTLLPSLTEQQKIADCLSSLDAVIAAEWDRLTALKAHKKGLMHELFPVEGKTTPRLRFPEFEGAGEWGARPLKAICDLRAGRFVSASDIADESENGLYPCYGGNGLRGYTVSYTHSGTFPLIGRQGAHCGNVKFVTGNFHATEHALVAMPKAAISVGWLFYELVSLELNRFATGQAQPGLSVDVLEKISCCIPKEVTEQQKIADCLATLDTLITAQGDKIDALKVQKSGLMQQLFPSPVAGTA